MAAELEKLAKYYTDKSNKPRADLYTALAAEERAIGGLETVIPVQLTPKTATKSSVIAPKTELITALSPETQRLVEQMRNDGYTVYDLAGKTPAVLRTEGMKFWYVNPALETATAVPALVAFKKKPSEFFLRRSKNTPFEKQLKLLEEEKEKVKRKYPDAGLIVRLGKPSEWSEAAFEHFKATGVRIFGKDYGYNYTWVNAYESDQVGARRAIVGDWNETHGLGVDFDRPDGVGSGLGLAPLVEIPRK